MTKTVFLSGSRKIGDLNEKIRQRIDKMVENGLRIIVGDASGADTAFQCYLAELHYENVKIYCSGQVCRNNVGNWDVEYVKVENNVKGRAFFTVKDKVMARNSDYGFALWDGKSVGTVNNILEFLSDNKIVVVYFSPSGSFFNLKASADLNTLIRNCSESHIARLKKETKLDKYLGNQGEITFTH